MRRSNAPSILYLRWYAVLHVPLFWLFFVLPTTTAQMPYNPTRLLQNGTLLYVFQPSTSSPGQFQLGSIDLSSRVAASSLPYTTLYPSLPFLDPNPLRAFTPVLDGEGVMTVYTGDCAKGAAGAEVWAFTPTKSEDAGKGSWKQEHATYDASDSHAPTIGPNYLNAGIAFSSVVDDATPNAGAYFFGGMCPFGRDHKDWQSAANYSNLMVTLQPSQESTSVGYQISECSSRGPPIPEAGFTLTGLQPSFSNRSDGTQTQQQNFVLVGGHTSSAFINMSQVALFALPQQGWTFVPVDRPNPQRTDLAVRSDVDTVEPRSGHTAVLTPDGQRIVIFGGWIGDTDTPAEPQLAILNVGEGYGGDRAWEWTAPSTSGTGLPDNSGLFGHGATMLPGGIMMITGGYSISAPSSRRRRAGLTANTQTLFFNTSSNSWVADYIPPQNLTPPEPGQTDSPLPKTSQKAGLGAGLGIGMAAVLSLAGFYIWYTRRLKKQRELREKQIRELAMTAHKYNLECLTPGVDGRGGNTDAIDYLEDPNDSYFYPSTGQPQHQGWRRPNGRDAERTGLLVEIPSPTRGLRRSLSGRGSHYLSRFDDRRVLGSGNIHPIDELEEEQEQAATNNNKPPPTSQPEMSERASQGTSIFDNAPVLDPFTDAQRHNVPRVAQKDPQAHSAPPSPVREVVEENSWQMALGAVVPGPTSPSSTGRVSPDKSDRTGSNLSDRSMRSNLTSTSTSGSLGRSASMRSAAMLSITNPFKTPSGSPTTDTMDRDSGAGGQSPVDPRTRSFTSTRSNRSNGVPNTANADADSFTTARTSFMQLQVEGQALLGGNPEAVRPGTSSTSNGSYPYTSSGTEPSMSRAGTVIEATSSSHHPIPRRERRKSWLGSVRRALSRSTTTGTAHRRTLTPTPLSEPYTDDPPSTMSAGANRCSLASIAPPRRAASDASFWRSKRGRQDWLDDELDENDPQTRWRRNSGDDWGAPEDLVLAEKERQRREWRERGNLISLSDDEHLPSPQTSHSPRDPDRPSTPVDELDWDVEAAVERRVVQVMFTVPKSRLRVVNADVDGSSILSMPRDDKAPDKGDTPNGSKVSASPSRVKDLVGRFEQQGSPRATPRTTPRPSPSPSVKSVKLRGQGSSASLAAKQKESSSSLRAQRVASNGTVKDQERAMGCP